MCRCRDPETWSLSLRGTQPGNKRQILNKQTLQIKYITTKQTQACWPCTEGQKQEDREFQDSLCYIARPWLKKQQKLPKVASGNWPDPSRPLWVVSLLQPHWGGTRWGRQHTQMQESSALLHWRFWETPRKPPTPPLSPSTLLSAHCEIWLPSWRVCKGAFRETDQEPRGAGV
jgi:hypothetical protein